MTAKERAAVQGFINKITELDEIESETLHALQDINAEHGDGHRWCSWKANLDGVIANQERNSVWRGRAEHQFEKYVKASAQRDLIQNFGGTLAELGFWK